MRVPRNIHAQLYSLDRSVGLTISDDTAHGLAWVQRACPQRVAITTVTQEVILVTATEQCWNEGGREGGRERVKEGERERERERE